MTKPMPFSVEVSGRTVTGHVRRSKTSETDLILDIDPIDADRNTRDITDAELADVKLQVTRMIVGIAE